MGDATVVKGFSNASKVLTYNGLKYVDDLTESDMLYTYDIDGGYSGYSKVTSVGVLRDGFYNLTDLRLTGSNGLLLSPTNPLIVTTKSGLLLSHSSGVVKGVNLLVCISDDIKELNLNVDMYVEGVISGALDILVDSSIRLKCSNVKILGESLKSKGVKFNIGTNGYMRLLEPITEINRGLIDGIWSKGVSARLSYLLGILECITEGVVDKSRLRLKHTDADFILELSYLMLTVGIIPMYIGEECGYTILDYIVPVNIRKLYNSKLYDVLEDTYDIISESRIVKREGEGTRGIRLYFRNLEQNPIKLSYDYYSHIVELGFSKSKYCFVSTLGVPMML